jgi:hypothetical protein
VLVFSLNDRLALLAILGCQASVPMTPPAMNSGGPPAAQCLKCPHHFDGFNCSLGPFRCTYIYVVAQYESGAKGRLVQDQPAFAFVLPWGLAHVIHADEDIYRSSWAPSMSTLREFLFVLG